MPMDERELIQRLQPQPAYLCCRVVTETTHIQNVVCEVVTGSALHATNPAVAPLGTAMRIPLDPHLPKQLEVQLCLRGQQNNVLAATRILLGAGETTHTFAFGQSTATAVLSIDCAVLVTSTPSTPAAIPEADLINMLRGEGRAEGLPTLPVYERNERNVRREERRLAKASLAAQAVPVLVEWRERMQGCADGGGGGAVVAPPARCVRGRASISSHLRAIEEMTVTQGRGSLLNELESRLRFATDMPQSAREVFACIAYVRYLTPAVAAVLPGLQLSELLTLHLLSQTPQNVDRDAGFRDVPPLHRSGEPASFARARDLYTQRHTDVEWSGGPPMRNGVLLLPCHEAPWLWCSAVRVCRFGVAELWHAEMQETQETQYQVGDTFMWDALQTAHTTRDSALAVVGPAATVFRIAYPPRVAPLHPMGRGTTSAYLLSPLLRYIVRGVVQGEGLLVELEAVDVVGEDPVGQRIMDAAGVCVKEDSAALWQGVQRLEAQALRGSGLYVNDDESTAGSDTTCAYEEAMERVLRLAEGNQHCLPNGMHDALLEVQAVLKRERAESRQTLSAAEEAVEQAHDERAEADVVLAETEARMDIAQNASDAYITLLHEHAHQIRQHLTAHLTTSVNELQRHHELEAHTEASKLKQRQKEALRLHVQSMFEPRSGLLLLRKFWGRLYGLATKSAHVRAQRKLLGTVLIKQAQVASVPLWQRYFQKWKRYVVRLRARVHARSAITTLSKRALLARCFSHLYNHAAGRLAQHSHSHTKQMAYVDRNEIHTQEHFHRHSIERDEAVVRAEIEGWKRGFWRREAVYLQRKREDEDVQVRAFCRIVEELRGCVSQEDAWRLSGDVDSVSSRRMALRMTQLASEELRRLRVLLQDPKGARPSPSPSPLRRVSSPNTEALAELKRAVMDTKPQPRNRTPAHLPTPQGYPSPLVPTALSY